jgi:hypothetical protein
MTLNEILTLVGLVTGPIAAVGVTLWIEQRRRVRERRLYVLRMMLTTRHMPADPQWNAAVNLIPVEFNDQEKVMTAWRTYGERVNQRVQKEHEAEHQKRIDAAQSGMIFEAMHSAGLSNLSEGDIQTQAYVSQGFVNRDMIYIESLRAMPAIAETLEKQRALTQRMVEALPQR